MGPFHCATVTSIIAYFLLLHLHNVSPRALRIAILNFQGSRMVGWNIIFSDFQISIVGKQGTKQCQKWQVLNFLDLRLMMEWRIWQDWREQNEWSGGCVVFT